jgi:hypothetical protein
MAAQQPQGKSWSCILRGPFLVSAVSLSLITPYFLQLSTNTLVHLAIAVVGVLCFFHDLISYLDSQVKATLHQFLDGLVLDDLFRAFYDPENGLIPSLVGGFMGASSMYGLRLNEEQKTRLVQASLSINYDQANSLLMSPGGCKAWLPPAIQTWLDNQTKQIKAIEYEEVDEEASEDIIPASPAPASSEPFVQESSDSSEDANNSSSQKGASTSSESSCKHEFSFENPRMDTPTDPLSEMFTIIRGLAFERMKPYIQSIPESMLENVGMSAIAILGLQLGFRKRTQSTLRFICNTALSGVATGAISTVVARRMILDNASFQTIIKTVTLRTWQKIKSSALGRERWQSTLAMIVLMLVGRNERQRGASNLFRR